MGVHEPLSRQSEVNPDPVDPALPQRLERLGLAPGPGDRALSIVSAPDRPFDRRVAAEV